MTEFDYRSLLVRYIAHVGSVEGVTFLREEHMLRRKFTPEEIAELRKLDSESDVEFKND